MGDKELKIKIEELENKLKEQQEAIDELRKKARRHKWLIVSALCDKD